MIKYIFAGLVAFVLVACGSNGDILPACEAGKVKNRWGVCVTPEAPVDHNANRKT